MAQQPHPLTRARRRGAVGFAVSLVLLTGCTLFDSGSDGASKDGSGGGQITIQRVNFPTLDPHIVTYGMWMDEQGLLEGLVVQNNKGTDAVPATSDKWTVSDDLKTYTFHIRDDAKWSNGDPVTAQDFAWTYQRLLSPQQAASGVTLGANSYQLSLGIKGAADFSSGKSKDFAQVGIKALGKSQLQITLDNANPGFLMGLTHPSMLPLHRKTLEKFPKTWQQPEHWVGNGPFVVKKWVLNSSMRVTPNPEYWDRADVFLDQVNVQLVEGEPSTVAYRNGEVDIMGLSPANMTEFQKDPELKSALGVVPATTVAYLALMRSENPALQDRRVRQALSLGLNRESVTKVSPDSHPGPSLVPSSVPGYDKSLDTAYDPDQAKQLLADAGYPGGKGLPTIRILSGSSVPLIDAIVDQWQQVLGIKVKADVVEVGAYVEKRSQAHPSNYAGFYIGYFSGLPTMPSFAGQLWGPTFIEELSLPTDVWRDYLKVQADTKLDPADRSGQLTQLLSQNASDEAKQYADLAAQANLASDQDQQTQLFLQAAKTRGDTYLVLPVAWQDSIYAVRPSLEGVHLRSTLEGFYLKGIKVTNGKG